MFRSAIRTRIARVVLVAGALLAATAGGAYATGVLGSPVGADGVIHGCYQKFNGSLRLVAAANPACRTSEQQIAWSQTGPKGDKGDLGEKGDTGQPGFQGERGPAGASGANGANGVSGYRINSFDFTVTRTALNTSSSSCRADEVVVGGGAWLFTNADNLDVPPRLIQSAPIDARTWEVKIDNLGSPRSWDYRLQIICARAS